MCIFQHLHLKRRFGTSEIDLTHPFPTSVVFNTERSMAVVLVILFLDWRCDCSLWDILSALSCSSA